MRMQGVSFESIPAMHIPFRFFNTAPWMGVLAAISLIVGSSAGLHSQWTPSLLAATHFITLGFMATIMLGALFQLLPVISGVQIPYTTFVATFVHLALFAGVPLLASGFLLKQYELFWFAIPILMSGFLVFLSAFGVLLLRKINGGDSILAVRLAALSLLITIILGVCRAAAYMGYPLLSDIPNIAYIHLLWGLVGWVLLLVMGISYQVIPMFHVTPNYSPRISKLLPVVVFISLLLITFVEHEVGQALLITLMCVVVLVYAIFSLWLLTKRKRKITDITVNFWRVALICLAFSSVLLLGRFFLSYWLTPSFDWKTLHIILGIIVIYGFACSVIMGMLQKIIPFLLYMHMQLQCKGDINRLRVLPNMHQIISAKQSLWQFRLHVFALFLLLVSAIVPVLVHLAALAMMIDFFWLGFTVARATKKYMSVRREILIVKVS